MPLNQDILGPSASDNNKYYNTEYVHTS